MDEELDEATAAGFYMALELMSSLGAVVEMGTLMTRLDEVARGEVTTLNSPQEEIAVREKRFGPMTIEEKIAYTKLMSGRSRLRMDDDMQLAAARILAFNSRQV